MLRKSRFRERSSLLSGVTRALDAIVVILAGWIAYAIRMESWGLPQRYQIALLLGALLTLVAFSALGVYHSWRGRPTSAQVRQLLLAWLLVGGVLMVLGVATKTNALFSRGWMALWLGFGGLALVAARGVLAVTLRETQKRGWNLRRIVLAGSGPQAAAVARQLEELAWNGLEIAAWFYEARPPPVEQSDQIPAHPLAEFPGFVERQSVDEVWLTLSAGSEHRIPELLDQLRYSTVDIRYVPSIENFRLLNPSISEVAGIAVLDLNVSPMRGINRILKGIEDRLLAVVILALISPLMLVIALGVKLSSPGPVLFRQSRNGCDGKPIEIYKFRTMVLHEEPEGTVTQASSGDPRITRFGAFLRRFSLDELPQFINVLQGRMSIVGPRPHALEHNEYYKYRVESYMWRHRVKPGITGWAQVNGWRGATDTLDKMERRVDHDLWYIDHWSLWLDLRIIFLTAIRVLRDRNAY
jgi:Undecaprenyl-phosphate glucose phosphotransferase